MEDTLPGLGMDDKGYFVLPRDGRGVAVAGEGRDAAGGCTRQAGAVPKPAIN